MKKRPLLLLTFLILIFLSCKDEERKENEKPTDDILTEIPFPGGKNTALPPHLFTGKERTLLSWVETINDSTSKLQFSYFNNGQWSQPSEVVSGSNWFVNWADYPMVTENNGNLLAHYLKKSAPATFAYDIHLRLRQRKEQKWLAQNELHTDGTPTEHGFVTALPYHADSFFLTWLDGRETAIDNDDKKQNGHSHHEGNMTLRSAIVSANGEVAEPTLLDPKTCSCCQTTAAMTENGPVVLYRDRSDEEVRDIVITRRINGEWTEPKPIFDDHWKIHGCPVNGPKVAALDNHLVVAWYTAANEKLEVKVSFSQNNGEDFDMPIKVSGPQPLGRVDVVLLDKENAVVSWMETSNDNTYIKAMRVHRDGKKSAAMTIAALDGSRKTGFPQMTLVEDQLVFAWTSLYEDSTIIKTGGKVAVAVFDILD